MAQNVEKQQELAVEEAVNKTEAFFEKNGKNILIAVLAVVILVCCGYAYKKLVVDKKAEKALELIVSAQDRLNDPNPDFSLALNGDENGVGFLDIVEKYGNTPAGNLAKHYAGECYLHLGELDNAEKMLTGFNAVDGLPGEIVNAQNLGLQGDVASERGDYEKAAKLYDKAVKASKNNYTAPLYLYKEALALKACGELAKAKECIETLSSNYPNALEARDAEKFLGTLE